MDVLLEVPLKDGGTIVVEVEQEQAGPVPAGRGTGEIVARATEEFESAISGALKGAEALFKQLRSISAPDEVVVEFGLKVTGEAGIVFSKVGGEGNFNVKLTWKGETSTPA